MIAYQSLTLSISILCAISAESLLMFCLYAGGFLPDTYGYLVQNG